MSIQVIKRCPYQCCKSCCSKAQNPCAIHDDQADSCNLFVVVGSYSTFPQDIHEKTGLPGVDMRVKEATDEFSLMTVLEPKICELQAGQLILQEAPRDSRLQGCWDRKCSSTSNNDCILWISTSKMSSSERESDLCTDKSVIEVSSELVICCKEGPDHVIKDICVDEGTPSKKNIFVESGATDKTENLVHFDVDKDTDLSVKDISSILDDFAVHSGGKQGDHSRQFVLPDYESIYDDDLEKSLIGGWPGRIKYIACEKLMSKQSSEVVTTSQSFVAIVADSGIEQQKYNQVRTQEETTDAVEDSNCKTAKETASSISGNEMHNGTTNTNPKLPEPQPIWGEEKKNIDFRDGHHDSHTLLEHGLEHDGLEGYASSSKSSMCTLNEVSAADSRNPSTTTKDLPGNLCHALAEHGTEYIDSTGLGASSQGSLSGNNEINGSETRKLDTNHVDMSGNMYPGTNPVSASIAYSGPTAYSGSISLRSDSSTTSARSFAFPILSSEWNTSPVKMAAADPKQLRKHRGWRMALLCCRF